MSVLALELSSAVGSIARIGGAEPIVREFANDRRHSGRFFEELREVYSPTDAPAIIAVGLGPGSYAGVRIAIACATGLRAASGARLVGIPSVCALPAEANEYHVIGDARRQSFFFARIVNRACVEEPSLWSAGELDVLLNQTPQVPLFSTQSLPRFPRALIGYPSALELARLAAVTGAAPDRELALEPIYLREPHITIPKVARLRTAVGG